MLKDSYKKENIYEKINLSPSMDIDPELKVIDNLLDDDQIYSTVKADLSNRYPNTETTGRPSTPVEVILRMIILMHLYAWSFAQTVKFVIVSPYGSFAASISMMSLPKVPLSAGIIA